MTRLVRCFCASCGLPSYWTVPFDITVGVFLARRRCGRCFGASLREATSRLSPPEVVTTGGTLGLRMVAK